MVENDTLKATSRPGTMADRDIFRSWSVRVCARGSFFSLRSWNKSTVKICSNLPTVYKLQHEQESVTQNNVKTKDLFSTTNCLKMSTFVVVGIDRNT